MIPMSTPTTGKTRPEALTLLKTYNAEPFHIRHALTVEAVMGWFAQELGHGEEREFWSTAGLMHDVDFEKWPEEHCVKAPELLKEAGFTGELIHAVCSHGWGMTGTDCKPELEMEKVLFACDELTGLIGAAALMRPSKSTKDMELKSLKKKFKDKKFAAGCSRECIAQGAELLGWELDDLLDKTLRAMAETEDAVEAEVSANT
jgi:predicted hydrolase (HD superfamily)